MKDRNLELLTTVAQFAAPLLDELVFVGGCTTALFIDDPAAGEVRPTYDVDAIVEIASYAEYGVFSERLRRLGFTEDQTEGAPICRWLRRDIRLDIMPTDERILGFSNRWYKPAVTNAQEVQLEGDLTIRSVTAPFFLGTKLEAFKGRGKKDYFASHDLEDLVAVIDGRSSLLAELEQSPRDLKDYIAGQIGNLLEVTDFTDALPGYLLPDPGSQARLGQLLTKLRSIAALNQ